MAKRIIITIDPEGNPTVKTEGYTGPACKDASRAIEEALGVKTAERLTADYHQRSENRPELKQGT